MPATSNAGTSNSGKRNQRACTTCRQVKLRCDSIHTFPAPCSRCSKRNLQCRTDPDFKRLRSRNRLEEVTSQLAAIQRTLGIQASDSSPESHQSQNLSPANPQFSIEDGRPVDSRKNLEEHRPLLFQRSPPSSIQATSTASLGQVELQYLQIAELFEHFNLHYFRHCPILDTNMTRSLLEQRSPILFWTIAIIASRWNPSLSHLYDMLLESYKNLLAQTLLKSIESIETIQAVVMLCFWPLSVERQPEDPSWFYCGMITNAAMKMDLHQLSDAEGAKSDLAERQMLIRRMTWLACVHANCWHGWKVRVVIGSEVLSSYLTITQPLSRTERDFVATVQTLRQFSQFSATIAQINPGLSAWSFVQTLCKEFENLQDDFGNPPSAETELAVLGAQLGLYSLQLERGQSLAKHSISANRELDTFRKVFINLAYMTAARFINTFSDMLQRALQVEKTEKFAPQRALPKHYLGLLVFAAIFIFKAHIQVVYEIFSAWSLKKMDEPGRVLRMLDVLLRAEKQSQLKFNESYSIARPGVNIVTDVISTAKTLRKTEERFSQSVEVAMTAEDPIHESMEAQNISEFADHFGSFEDLQDSLMEWNFPWDLEMPMVERFEFDTDNLFGHDQMLFTN